MFSFHKPRVYRSTEGCCICRAKSSSSRFTDSKKYENDSMNCFDLKQPRYGEICNACVLLVKRYKRLPVGSNRHWGHVVDARAGPGTKSLTKYKKHREDTDSATNSPTTSSNHHTHNSKSLITEKFSKIFKKNKKLKNSSPTSVMASAVGAKKDNGCNSTKRKSSPFPSTQQQSWDSRNHPQSLPSTPDSLDSDYEDNRITSPSSTVVQFQTQTRASSYRSRNFGHISNNTNNTTIVSHKRRSIVKAIGSKRRKCLQPRKNNRAIQIESVQFFDESEWQQRKSCCGMVYECLALGNAILVDLEHYKPCKEHEKKDKNLKGKQQPQTLFTQKTIIATMPAVVQLPAATAIPTPNSKPVSNNINTNPTPVLKKHHLFFKRQSECFPHADLGLINNNINTNQMTKPPTKTDSEISTDNTATDMTPPTTTITPTATTTNLSINIPPTQLQTTTIITCAQQQSISLMPKHSMAKITTISPTSSAIVAPPNNNNNKSSSFLHKIKADTGKIVKHSLEKINTAVRLKPGDLHDMRHMIKTVDKSSLLTKHYIHPVSQHQVNNNNISIVSPSQTAFTTATLSSSSSSSATKFSDNSSDSGFDENLQDRKSVSPLQEDTRPGVQTMFLASGVQIQGQQQNLVLTGNEVAAKILQNRRQHSATALHQHNNNHSTATAVKIAQIVGGGGVSHKMRAIYNNNTIQHENGVTTIVPASSLTASSQTASMSALAPSTVTITPSPTMATTINNKKLSVTPTPGHCVIGINGSVAAGAAMTVSTNNVGGEMSLSHNQSHVGTTHLTTISNNVSSLNPKIILVKTAKYNNSSSNSNNNNYNNAATVATATSGHHQHYNATTALSHHSTCKN